MSTATRRRLRRRQRRRRLAGRRRRPAATCDATLIPVVIGDLDLPVLDDLVKLCVQLDCVDHGADRPDRPADDSRTDSQAQAPASPSREALQQAIIGKTTILLLHS